MKPYREIKEKTRKAIINLIKKARGTAVSFTPAKLARLAGLPVNPALCSIIRHYLETELGLECYRKSCLGRRYIIDKYQHPDLWNLAKNS